MEQRKKPRVLFISTARSVGGGEIYLANILPLLKERYDCTVLATRPVMRLLGASAATQRIILFPKNIEKVMKRSYRVKKTYYRLYFKRFLRKNGFDIINLQEFDGAFVDALDFKPVILTEQTRLFIPDNLRASFKNLFEKIDRVICVSRQTLDDIAALGAPGQKCVVIHNGVDTNKFKPSETEGEYISWIGRVEEEDKNPLLFLQTAVAAQAEGLNYKFRLVGDGRAMPKILAYAKENKLSNLEIVGFKDPGEMVNVYKQTKILCLTSKTEGIPFAVLEAMACGKPVISTKVGGLPEIINSNKVGTLIDGFDKQKFLAEIKKLMEDEQLYLQTSRAARTRIEKSFSIKHQVEQISEQYDRLLGGYE
jgi:glycosyltransferase involved in cell wall biosynthesis